MSLDGKMLQQKQLSVHPGNQTVVKVKLLYLARTTALIIYRHFCKHGLNTTCNNKLGDRRKTAKYHEVSHL